MTARNVSLFPWNKFNPAHPDSEPSTSSVAAEVTKGLHRG